MTRNPYADPSSFDPEPQPTRVSGLAVTSLVFGLLCCIPVVGIFAMILGGSSLVAISRSEGRLTGRGLATAGLVLGLLGTIWTGLIAFGTLQFQSQVQSLTGSYEYAEKHDYAAFRNLFTPAAQQQLTDARIDEFAAEVEKVWGKHRGATKGIGEIISGYGAVAPMFERAPQSASGDVIPVPIKFEKGHALAFVRINTRQMNSRNMPAMENMFIMDPDGNAIWLLPPQSGGAAPSPSAIPGAPPPPETPPPEPDQPDPAETPAPPPGESP